ncbi:hypothetical protein Taro_043846 [Colocasia esculenta]|uniref:Proteasome endopeptidase complex n=1 Tax=Colocasia esculenta TaxID=4460 RepID=A0A843WM45_COLES|nr:hypothetical protein [Colocasia esculenta]
MLYSLGIHERDVHMNMAVCKGTYTENQKGFHRCLSITALLLFLDMVSSQLQLHRYATGRESRVVTALTLLKSHLFSYQGHVSAALVLGGVDVTGPHLHTIYPHGSTDTLPYATMGSGSLAAMAVFESKYREGLTKDEGIKLVCEAICSGIFNDLGSGSNVDVCVITKGHVEYLRNYQLPNPRTYISSRGYSFSKGQTEVLSTKITPLKQKAVAAEGDLMEEELLHRSREIHDLRKVKIGSSLST